MKPTPEDVATYLSEKLCRVISEAVGRTATHTALQRLTSQGAIDFGMRHMTEYRLDNPFGDGRSRYIDVVWFKRSQLLAAFGIDSSLRAKSIRKLLSIPAEYKLWIYYGHRKPDSFISDLDTTGSILVLDLGLRRSFRAVTVSPSLTTLDVVLNTSMQMSEALPPVVIPYQKDFANLKDKGTQFTKPLRVKTKAVSLRSPEPHLSDCNDKELGVATYHDRLNKIKQRHPMAYERWTEHDDNELRRHYLAGASVKLLASIFKRQPSAITSRLRKLKLQG